MAGWPAAISARTGADTGLDEALGAASEGDASGGRLQAPPKAAAAGRSGGVEDDVADLAGESLGAPVEASIDDEPAADARPEGGVEEVAGPLPRAEAVLAEGRGRGVVLDGDGDPEALGERLGQGEVAEGGDVGGDHDDAALGVDEAGDGEGGGDGRLRAPVADPGQEVADVLEDGIG